VDLYVLERALISMHSSCGDVVRRLHKLIFKLLSLKCLVNIWFCLTVILHLGPTDLCKHFRLYSTKLVHLPCGFMIFPFVRGILFPMVSMLVWYLVLIMP